MLTMMASNHRSSSRQQEEEGKAGNTQVRPSTSVLAQTRAGSLLNNQLRHIPASSPPQGNSLADMDNSSPLHRATSNRATRSTSHTVSLNTDSKAMGTRQRVIRPTGSRPMASKEGFKEGIKRRRQHREDIQVKIRPLA